MNEKTQPIYVIRIVDNNPNTKCKELVANLSNPVGYTNRDVSVFWNDMASRFIKCAHDFYHTSPNEAKDYLNYVNIEIWIGESENSTECNLIYKLFEFRGIELMNDLVADDLEYVLISFYKNYPPKLSDDYTCKYSFAF